MSVALPRGCLALQGPALPPHQLDRATAPFLSKRTAILVSSKLTKAICFPKAVAWCFKKSSHMKYKAALQARHEEACKGSHFGALRRPYSWAPSRSYPYKRKGRAPLFGPPKHFKTGPKTRPNIGPRKITKSAWRRPVLPSQPRQWYRIANRRDAVT